MWRAYLVNYKTIKDIILLVELSLTENYNLLW